MKLTDTQRHALDSVRSLPPGGVHILRGYAGTGKTVTAAAVTDAFATEQRKVLVAAPTAAALAVLRGKLRTSPNLTFKTLASLLTHPVQYIEGSQSGPAMRMYVDAESLEKTAGTFTALGVDVTSVFTCRFRDRVVPFERTGGALRGLRSVVIDTGLLTSRVNDKFGGASPFGVFSDDTEFILHSPAAVAEALAEYALIVVDEYSMVPEEQSAVLIEAVKTAARSVAKGPRMLCVGDPAQLQPVDGPMASPMRDNPPHPMTELTEILRSTDDVAYVAQAMRIGKSLRVLPTVDQRGVVTVERATSAVGAYDRHRDICDGADVLLTFTNRDVSALNDLIRRNAGRGVEVEVGDELVCTTNAGYVAGEVPEFVNGELLTVARIADSDETARFIAKASRRVTAEDLDVLSAGLNSRSALLVELTPHDTSSSQRKFAIVTPTLSKSLSFAVKQLRDAVNENFEALGVAFILADYAYAMTVHKAQGSEWKKVVYLVSDRDLAIQKSWHPPYTAITRAKEKIDVIWIRD